VALVQALRESFPSEIGALYAKEELGIDEDKIINIKQEIKEEIKNEANKEFVDIPVDIKADMKEEKTPTVDAEIVTEKDEEDEIPY
ncbi:phage recombination protein Bet, partial [Clostridium estertheticum]|nr:phage recombination protein Bet [Clostridium estertheticum]